MPRAEEPRPAAAGAEPEKEGEGGAAGAERRPLSEELDLLHKEVREIIETLDRMERLV